MIKGNINDYSGILSEYVDIIKGISPDHPLGRFELEGGAYYNVVISKSRKEEDALYEAHRKYIDIHYCIEGSEGIGYNNVTRITPTTEYFENDDYQLFRGDHFKVILGKGDFCIVFPEDAHIPCLVANEEKRVLKAVAKIKIQE